MQSAQTIKIDSIHAHRKQQWEKVSIDRQKQKQEIDFVQQMAFYSQSNTTLLLSPEMSVDRNLCFFIPLNKTRFTRKRTEQKIISIIF